MQESIYYIAQGRSLDVVLAFVAARKAYMEAVGVLVEAHGIPKELLLGVSGGALVGWYPTEGVSAPDALRLDKRHGGLVPNRKTDTGKALAAAIKKLNEGFYSNETLTRDLCGQVPLSVKSSGLSIHTYGFERLGDEWIIFTEEGDPPPYDAKPLARSAYWTRREYVAAVERTKAQAQAQGA